MLFSFLPVSLIYLSHALAFHFLCPTGRSAYMAYVCGKSLWVVVKHGLLLFRFARCRCSDIACQFESG